mgnify:CR=1 FL=1
MTLINSPTILAMAKSRTRQQYRTQLGIASDVLQVCMGAGIEGTLITKISRYANLSHYASMESCQKLIDAGLIESTKIQKNIVYKITSKGINFLSEFQRFQDLIKEVNIRY